MSCKDKLQVHLLLLDVRMIVPPLRCSPHSLLHRRLCEIENYFFEEEQGAEGVTDGYSGDAEGFYGEGTSQNYGGAEQHD